MKTKILDEDHTEVITVTKSAAKAFANNMIRQDKPFCAHPCGEDDGWRFVVREDNERTDYMGRA